MVRDRRLVYIISKTCRSGSHCLGFARMGFEDTYAATTGQDDLRNSIERVEEVLAKLFRIRQHGQLGSELHLRG